MNCDCLEHKHDTRAKGDCSHNKAFRYASNKRRLVILDASKKISAIQKRSEKKGGQEGSNCNELKNKGMSSCSAR
jgi:hypothetical protein